MFYLRRENLHKMLKKRKKWRNVFPTKQLDKTPKMRLNEMGVSSLPDGVLKCSLRCSLGLGNFNKAIANIRKFQTEFTEVRI